jgi:hypothetical protein
MSTSLIDSTALGAALGRRTVEEAVRVARLEVDLAEARHAKKVRDQSRSGRVRAALRQARTSPMGFLKAPVRILRALRAPSVLPEAPEPPRDAKQRRVRLVPARSESATEAAVELDPRCFPVGLIHRDGQGTIAAWSRDSGRLVSFATEGDATWGRRLPGALAVDELVAGLGRDVVVTFDAEAAGGPLSVHLSFLDESGAQVAAANCSSGGARQFSLPAGAVSARIILRTRGAGVALLRALRFTRPEPVASG